MKLIKVGYIEESSKAIFFNVTIEVKSFWSSPKEVTKRAFLEKWKMPGFRYANNFKWSDNTGFSNYDYAVIEEMILQYEKNTSHETNT